MAGLCLMVGLTGCQREPATSVPPAVDGPFPIRADPFFGSKGGDEREVADVKLCWCPPGRFLMGSPPDEPERRPDEAQVEVTLTKGFWMGKYEVTQGQWKRVAGKLPGELTAEGGEGDEFPVGNVNYPEAEAFCLKLTKMGRQSGELPPGWEFRLPTEAQWEYACRAGTKTATSFGDKLGSTQANFQGRSYNGAEQGPSLNRATKVGSYRANAWGLHDMHGNIYEWCRDWYHQQLPGGNDPDLSSLKGPMNRDGTFSRVRRGGAWCDHGWPCRSAARLRYEAERRYDHIGFRVAVVNDSVRVLIQTELGDIEVVLEPGKAPITTANFLKYVDGKYYDGGVFHRTVKPDNQPENKVRIEVIQAGVNPNKEKDQFPPIKLERTNQTKILHKDGAISMARDGPDTATTDFFICIGDQNSLDFGGQRNPDGQGFAAFGRVVNGMDVVKKIQAAPAEGQKLAPKVKLLKIVRKTGT
jgi:peptidyl-prolyl cis-trans isomerase A (cyclophilin A)